MAKIKTELNEVCTKCNEFTRSLTTINVQGISLIIEIHCKVCGMQKMKLKFMGKVLEIAGKKVT